MDSKLSLYLGRIVLAVGLIVGLVAGLQNPQYPEDMGFHWMAAIFWWAGAIISGLLLFGISAALEYLEDILYHLRCLRYPDSVVPPTKLGNSRMSLDALKDYKMESKD
ncbi:MAG: hypothetical protein K6T85_12830 [Gorillibacterium sp.]|nr:hypothetical protein [Gorillibacterium sp.]